MFAFFNRQHPTGGRSSSVAIWLSLGCLALSFLVIALAIRTGETRLDIAIAALIRSDGPARPNTFWAIFWHDVTVLGSGPIISIIAFFVLGYLVLARHHRTALAFGLGIALAIYSAYILKGLFGRPRPMSLNAYIALDNFSFPSGHSVASSALYPMLGALIAQVVDGPRLKVYSIASGVVVMLLIGISRIYLGVHYATDVLAGWCLGLAWALASGVVMARLRRRGVIETAAVACEPPAKKL